MTDLTENVPAMTDCNPGLSPSEFNVLIALAPEETTTKGGIILTNTTAEAKQSASMFGRLVAVSPLAFTYEHWPEGARKPVVGDAVLFAKYGGVLVTGADDREYRVMKDRDVAAIIEQEA